MQSRKELYQAVKYEVENFQGDHGCDLTQMWKLANTDKFWYDVCLDDYNESRY